MAPVYVDLSHTLDQDVQIYPGDPAFTCCPVQTIPKDGNSVHSISMGSHTGTHVDAPSHFIEDGSSIDQLPLSAFVGNAIVVDVTRKSAKDRISWADIAAYEEIIRQKVALASGALVLLRTGWSKHWKTSTYLDHPFLDSQAAKHLLDLGIRVLGVDTMSPDETHTDEAVDGDFGVHEAILAADGMIVENLTGLEQLPGIRLHVSLLPMKIAHCDGSPVRAIAWQPATED